MGPWLMNGAVAVYEACHIKAQPLCDKLCCAVLKLMPVYREPELHAGNRS